jgi:predicted phosphoadenosine phosphosulfate sulfurtransferase
VAIKRRAASITVLEAAKIRIKNVFGNGLPVYFSFSAGKDSLTLAQLMLTMIQAGEISAAQLIVQFIDEEAIYPCMEETALKWRKKFLMVGARFDWFCIEIRHYNCFNSLENDESFICWDSQKESVWIRRPPAFAIRKHPLLRPRVDTFQDFLPRTSRNGVTITGIRVYESVQRLGYFASMISSGHTMTKKNQVFPIYDWRDCDVWRCLYENNVEIPEIYHYSYSVLK